MTKISKSIHRLDVNKLEALWTRQLYLEHEKICFQRRLKLPKICIRLSEGRKTLGMWDESKQCLSISRDLIHSYSWEKVLEILKHEMAHQLVCVLHSEEVKAHGPEFLLACERLGVAEWARKANIDFDELKLAQSPSGIDEESQSILRRAKKLLSLTNSCNEHEAKQAMSKVRFLYKRYHLATLHKLNRPEFCSIKIGHDRARTEIYQSMLGNLLAKHFFVQVVHSQIYNSKHCREYKVIELIGTQSNVNLAEYIYWFIYNHLPTFWKTYSDKKEKTGLRSKNQFYQGLIDGLDEQFTRQNKSKAEKSDFSVDLEHKDHSLVQAEKGRLNKFVQELYPRLSHCSFSSKKSDRECREAGFKQGKEMTIHEGIAAKQRQPKRLLPEARA